eukprot:78670-Pleurochrysis_carterae.AAC.2
MLCGRSAFGLLLSALRARNAGAAAVNASSECEILSTIAGNTYLYALNHPTEPERRRARVQ